jgi:hypothetical protein
MIVIRPHPGLIAGAALGLVLLPALALGQTDVLTVAVTATGSTSGAVRVPVYLRDVAGSPLGVDQVAGHRISGVAFNITGWPNPCVTGLTVISTPATGLIGQYKAVISCNTVVEASTGVAGTNHAYVFGAPETGNQACGAIPFTPGAAAPGDKIVELELTLDNCPVALVIPLTITATGPVGAYLNSDSGTAEKVGQGLEVASGALTVGLGPAALAVDPSGNGVLEPGETVVVTPAWHNYSAAPVVLSGTASFAGPAGAEYGTPDAAASYGSVPATSTASCVPTGDCYSVSLSAPASRPAMHWDAVLTESVGSGTPKAWTVHVGQSFTDMPVSATQGSFYHYVETLLHSGTTAGCTTTAYCPTNQVTRAQMAMFIARAANGGVDSAVPVSGTVTGKGPYDCSATGTSLFTDVAPTAQYCRHVHFIASQVVTLGCTTTTYCPTTQVSRSQMAMFISRAIAGGEANVPMAYADAGSGRSYDCAPATASTYFADVPANVSYCKHVHYLWAKSVIAGCIASPPQYCPANMVRRDQMAKFLVNGFSFTLYHP